MIGYAYEQNMNEVEKGIGMASQHTANNPADTRRLAQAIDHTKLTFAEGESERESIELLCREAMQYGFFAVCVRPRHIAQAKALLAESPVKVATVIGFPLHKVQLQNELQHPTVGTITTEEKVAETAQSVQAGADELDLVINIAHLKQDMQDGGHRVYDELMAIRHVAADRLIKVIIETDLLLPEEIVQVTNWCAEIGMAMVKTSTGMVAGGHGATLDGVRLIADTLKSSNANTGIKASGGIKNRQQAESFLALGVNRLGTSSGVGIVKGDSTGEQATY